MKTAELIIDFPEKNADLYYATKFRAPDAVIYFKIGGKKYMIMNDLEIDRARKTAKVDAVLPLAKYLNKAKKPEKKPTKLDAVIVALKERHVKNLIVPETMSFTYVDTLRKNGFSVKAGPLPFYPARLTKTVEEKRYILDAQKTVYSAMKLAEDMIRKSATKKGVLHLGGKTLTSERVRDAIQMHLLEKGCIVTEPLIVACGKDTIDPHNPGHGPLMAHKAIIVDIYPKSMKTYFYGDATRTFCKGKAPKELKRLYNTVKTAQTTAICKIRAGVNGRKIHGGILDYFKKEGYPSGEFDGRMQGFIHSTGHGIGLELHEEPLRISNINLPFREGFVLSIEPGLYYKKTGGVRIEDLVYVTKKGCEVLGRYPKKLEIE